MVRYLLRGATHGVAFAAGFVAAAWVIGQGIRDGSIDAAIAKVRNK